MADVRAPARLRPSLAIGVVGVSAVVGWLGAAAIDGRAAGALELSVDAVSVSAAAASGDAAEVSGEAAGTEAAGVAEADPAADHVYVEPVPVTVTEDVASADAAAGILPGGVPSALSGDLLVVPGTVTAPGGGPVQSVRVEVEDGLPVDGASFAAFVMATLNDPRGWGADGSVRFSRTDGPADVRVVLASAATVDAMCAPLETNGRWSCGRYGHAALNADRWFFGADAFLDGGGDLTSYRHYLVNHEVGHLLGRQHADCSAPGAPAPVMLQQSLDLQDCLPNGWPFP